MRQTPIEVQTEGLGHLCCTDLFYSASQIDRDLHIRFQYGVSSECWFVFSIRKNKNVFNAVKITKNRFRRSEVQGPGPRFCNKKILGPNSTKQN